MEEDWAKEPFAFAGLGERWDHEGSAIDSSTIITGEPNELAAKVHDRMPVILSPEDYDAWLDPKTDAERLQSLLVPMLGRGMAMRPVSTRMNSPRNERPECVERTEEHDSWSIRNLAKNFLHLRRIV